MASGTAQMLAGIVDAISRIETTLARVEHRVAVAKQSRTQSDAESDVAASSNSVGSVPKDAWDELAESVGQLQIQAHPAATLQRPAGFMMVQNIPPPHPRHVRDPRWDTLEWWPDDVIAKDPFVTFKGENYWCSECNAGFSGSHGPGKRHQKRLRWANY
jgi:hypothetical protein